MNVVASAFDVRSERELCLCLVSCFRAIGHEL